MEHLFDLCGKAVAHQKLRQEGAGYLAERIDLHFQNGAGFRIHQEGKKQNLWRWEMGFSVAGLEIPVMYSV